MSLGITSAQREAVAVASSVVSAGGAAAGSAGASAAVTALLTAAGASAAVPFAGWIAAGVAASAAGIIALVGSLRRQRVKKSEAVEMARRLGFEDAAAIPGYTLRALEWSDARLDRTARRLQRRIGRKRDRASWRLRLRLQLLGVIAAYRALDKQQQQAALVSGGPAAAQAVALQQRAALLAARARYERTQALYVGAALAAAVLLIGVAR